MKQFPSPPDDEEFLELNHEIKQTLRSNQFNAGKRLAEMQERERYGPYRTFKDYVVAELRLTKQTAYNLIFAHKVDELFREHQCPPPVNERQVRPLKLLGKLATHEAKVIQVWKRACKMSQNNRPTGAMVMYEVKTIVGTVAATCGRERRSSLLPTPKVNRF